VSLAPVPSEQPAAGASCANCAAPLAPDQRYCLACGQPCSPVRLAFLDVLQAETQPYGAGQSPVGSLPSGYLPVNESTSGAYAWMRRYSGLFGLLSVLLMAIIVGLLVGHWVTQSKAPSQQVLRVEGLGSAAAAPVAPATSPTATSTTAAASTTAASTTPKPAASAASSKESAKTEAKEVQEAKAIEKKPPPKAVKVNSTKLQKLGSTTGKKHEEEVASLGAQPIETGGG
jgi:hypothetical protein